MPIDFKKLSDFFPPEAVEWKPITISKKTEKGLAAAYITARAIMDRLDEVCGPENWRNEFKAGPDGGVLCGISIRVGDDWITKWDGAENTDIEAVKGGLSSAMRRAAVQWGIGRYLYDFPQQWVAVDERGRFRQEPDIPPAYLPEGYKPAPRQHRPAQASSDQQRPQQGQRPAPQQPRPQQNARPQQRPNAPRPMPPFEDFAPEDPGF